MTPLATWLSLAALAGPPSHPLELRLVPGAGLAHEAQLHNPTTQAVWLQLPVPEYNAVDAELRDRRGVKLEGVHAWANRGAPRFSHRFERVEAGGSVVIGTFGWDAASGWARAAAWSWDLSGLRGSSVQLVFRLALDCSARTTEVDELGPPRRADAGKPARVEDVFCGALETAPTVIPLP